jgi:hypothetical protein
MASTALVLGAAGIAASFLPHDILVGLGVAPVVPLPLLVQLLGALLFGFALLNWLAKDMSIGGIYGRPIVVGNLAHFVIGALTLLKASVGGDSVVLWSAGGVYALFAIWFGLVLFSRPPTKDAAALD